MSPGERPSESTATRVGEDGDAFLLAVEEEAGLDVVSDMLHEVEHALAEAASSRAKSRQGFRDGQPAQTAFAAAAAPVAPRPGDQHASGCGRYFSDCQEGSYKHVPVRRGDG